MDADKEITRGIRFQRFMYKFALFFIGRFYTWKSDFTYEPYRPKNRTFLLLANHNMDLDPFQLVIGTKSHMRFVASESILKGPFGHIISFCVGPIPKKKGAPSDHLIDTIIRNLKNGISVSMHPETEKSWDGQTQAISPKTAKIAKESGAALITYRLYGGYLRTPHWGKNTRKGPTFGEVVHEYSPEDLKAMSEEEVYGAICRDLRVNAFEFQREEGHMYKYTGKDLAENLELTCYICPRCEAVGTMASKGDVLRCRECGFEVRYTEYGFLEGKDAVFDNSADWSAWQKKWLHENSKKLKGQVTEPIIVNKDVALYERTLQKKEICSGAQCCLYGDRIDIAKEGQVLESFKLKDITKLASFKTESISFTCRGAFYQIKSRTCPISGYEYFGLWRILTDREYY